MFKQKIRSTARLSADPLESAIGNRIRSLRQARGISQSKLAKALGISLQQVQKYEYGTNRMSVSTMIRAAEALGVAPEELVKHFETPAPQVERLAPSDLDQPGLDALIKGFVSLGSASQRAVVLSLLRELNTRTETARPKKRAKRPRGRNS